MKPAALPRLSSIKALVGQRVQFRLRDGSVHVADLSAVAARLRVLAPLDAPSVFRKVKIVDYGIAVHWPMAGDDAALSVQTLLRISRAQQAVTGRDFSAWMTRQRLTVADAARVFDVTDRTVKRWRAARDIPLVTGVLMRQIDDDPALLGALLAPVKRAA
jgi:hypothetical protein